MGLDMYLSARKFASEKLFSPELYSKVLDAVGTDVLPRKEIPSVEVEVGVAYWRKANAIHQWFVNNCQDGNDDCRPAHVSRAQLAELLDLAKQVKADPSLAEELLPTASGFFFGSTEYGEWYWQDIDETITQLEQVLESTSDDWDFQYQSSW
jgi:hypothetical protein